MNNKSPVKISIHRKLIFTYVVFFVCLFIISSNTFSQVSQEWVARYNGGVGSYWYDIATSIAVDISGNVYVTGYSFSYYFYSDYTTIKYDSSGDSLWVVRYNGSGNRNDRTYSLTVDDLGNVYVTGYSDGNGTYEDYVTIKYNSFGDSLWVARYNGPGNNDDVALSIAVDDLGNVYVTGFSYGNGSDLDYATIKYNSTGVLQWAARYNGLADSTDVAESLAIDGDGNIYVTGYSYGNGTSGDYCTIKYNSFGDSLWVARYCGLGNDFDEANAIAVDSSGNVYVTGRCKNGGMSYDYATIKYNSAGVQQWIAIYNGPGNIDDEANAIIVDAFGNAYVTGYSYGSGSGVDYATIKYDPLGDSLWVARYSGPGHSVTTDIAYSLAVDHLCNVYVTGYSYGNGSSSDYATVKYSSLGDSVWVVRYNGPGNGSDVANAIAVDDLGNVYVTGRSVGNEMSFDYATVKYSQQIGIKPISSEIPTAFSLKHNFPNPFNPTTKIMFDIPKSFLTKLVVYDILGREVATLVNDHLKPGVYEVEWNALNVPSGVYFYRIIAGDFSQTKRMVLVK